MDSAFQKICIKIDWPRYSVPTSANFLMLIGILLQTWKKQNKTKQKQTQKIDT